MVFITLAIGRINPDGTPWKPTKNSRICGDHFVSGKFSIESNHPDYVPSLFNDDRIFRKPKPKTKRDLARYERVSVLFMSWLHQFQNLNHYFKQELGFFVSNFEYSDWFKDWKTRKKLLKFCLEQLKIWLYKWLCE